MERNSEDLRKGMGGWPFPFAQSGGAEPGPAHPLQFDIQLATQITGASQPQIVVARDIGMEADVRSVQKEVESLKQETAEMKAMFEGLGTAEPVFELREVSYEDAKREIKQYFEAHHGESIDAGDLQEALGIDIQMVIQICQDLERDGQIKAL
jgi:hypothetical protein